ncbi:hypothetical protein pb186bvf_002361 [Paramecium bursaria]
MRNYIHQNKLQIFYQIRVEEQLEKIHLSILIIDLKSTFEIVNNFRN